MWGFKRSCRRCGTGGARCKRMQHQSTVSSSSTWHALRHSSHTIATVTSLLHALDSIVEAKTSQCC
jgi:hypothetical protein